MAASPENAVEPIEWRPFYRIIPSRSPPISLLKELADPAGLESVFAIEALTNDFLRGEVAPGCAADVFYYPFSTRFGF